MKKHLFFLLLLGACMVGCEEPPSTPVTKTVSIGDTNLNQYEIDGCEYIGYVYGGYGDFLTHKGNCHNPIHKQSKINDHE